MKRNISISIISLMLAISAVFVSGCIEINIPPADSTPQPTEIPADSTDIPTAAPTDAPTAEPTEAPTEIPPEPTAEIPPVNTLMIVPASDNISVSEIITDDYYEDGTYLYYAKELTGYFEGNKQYPVYSYCTNTAFAAEPNDGESMDDFIKWAISISEENAHDITIEESDGYYTGETVYPGYMAEWLTGFNEDTHLFQGIVIYAEGYVLMYYYDTACVDYDYACENIAQILSCAYLGSMNDAEG